MRKNLKEISIRSAKETDATLLASWWADGKIMAHAGFPKGIKTDVKKLKKRLSKNSKDKNSASELLIIEVDKTPIGEMNYKLVDQNIYEIGIKICHFSLHRQKFGTKSLTLLLDYLFIEKDAKKVILDTNLDNEKAQKFYIKLGFNQVKINVDSWTDQLGQKQSSIDYELTKERYLKRKEPSE
ncbi:MAG: GNAT family N-acetyltransferase [Candidatus Izimaplasma sp.]|nr:GNAT family N-acetyltransferase [Candidatus Izimaplasma bacterium]